MIDPLTKKEFTPSRPNQKFANRRNQIRFNNLKSAEKKRRKAAAAAGKAGKDRVFPRYTISSKQEMKNSSAAPKFSGIITDSRSAWIPSPTLQLWMGVATFSFLIGICIYSQR